MDLLEIYPTMVQKATSMAFLQQPSPITDEFLTMSYDTTKRSLCDIIYYLYQTYREDFPLSPNCEDHRYTSDVYLGLLFLLPKGLLWEDETDMSEMTEYEVSKYVMSFRTEDPTHESSILNKCQFLRYLIKDMPNADLIYILKLYEMIDDHLADAQVELLQADYEVEDFARATARTMDIGTGVPPILWYGRLTHMRKHVAALLGIVGDETLSAFKARSEGGHLPSPSLHNGFNSLVFN